MANFSSTYPSIRPVFNADFSNAGRLDSRITFSRSDTPPTYAAPSAVHYWSNEKHLSSENLWKHSDDLSHADNPINDNVDNLTVTGGQTGPTSSITTAVEIKPNTSNTTHRFYTNTGAVVSSGQLTFSVYAKASGYKNLHIFVNGPDDGATFDLSAATVTNDATYPPASTSITQVGSTGWYRCTLTTNSFSGNVQWQLQVRNDSDDYTYTGDGTSAIIVYGGQINTGSSALDYQATTTQIHREYAPTLKSVSTAGQPRFEYSPTDSASMGLLIEGSSTNLLNYSDDITNAWWDAGVGLNKDGNVAVGPDGTLTADMLRLDSSTGSHYIRRNSVTVTAATSHTLSAYVKPVGSVKCKLTAYENGGDYTGEISVIFDLSGSGSVQQAVTGSGTITALPNGWFRIAATGTTDSTSSTVQIAVMDNTGGGSFAGDGYSGLLVAKSQYEASSFASSPISTNGSAVTRASDSASLVTSSFYTGGPVTGIVDAVNIGAANYPTFAAMADSTGSQRVTVQGDATSANATTQVLTDGALVAYITRPLDIAASKVGFRIDTDNYACVVNGGSVATDTSGAIPSSPSTLHIGQNHVSQYQVNGNIKRIALYNEALSDTNLQALTS